MATSGTYNFANTQSIDLIEDAFLRIGIKPEFIVNEKAVIAQRTANLILADFMNRGMNLWTRASAMIPLVAGQPTYNLDPAINRILVANIRTSNRLLSGTPFSSAGGIAQNAFDGNPATACTQTAPNGYISYNYGVNNLTTVDMVGIQSNVTVDYTLVCEISNDNVTWTPVLTLPKQTYTLGINQWFEVTTPTPAQYFRVRETGGATLNVQELYFNNLVYDRNISEYSITEYYRLPYRFQTGVTSVYFFDRQIQPLISLWPVPDGQLFETLYYVYTKNIQDIGQLVDVVDVPQRFFNSFVAILAYQLALKFSDEIPQGRIQELKPIADEAFNRAAAEDTQRVPLRLNINPYISWARQ